jgi:hypothetical protein
MDIQKVRCKKFEATEIDGGQSVDQTVKHIEFKKIE